MKKLFSIVSPPTFHLAPRSLQGINDIRILTRQQYFNVQNGLLKEKILAEKLHNKIPTSYRMPNGYFQVGRALPKTRHQIYFIISTDVKRTNHSS